MGQILFDKIYLDISSYYTTKNNQMQGYFENNCIFVRDLFFRFVQAVCAGKSRWEKKEEKKQEDVKFLCAKNE